MVSVGISGMVPVGIFGWNGIGWTFGRNDIGWDLWAKCPWLPGCFLNGTSKNYKFLGLNANLNSCLLESNQLEQRPNH
ncbi:unnamed protein product [Rhizophagus irregularis]|nr:unnamed protein product [Rhizophagus irregularis]